MGAVSIKGKCASVIKDQVVAVGDMAMSIATLGASKLASTPGKVKKSKELTKKWKALKQKYKTLKKANPKLKDAEKAQKSYKDAEDVNDGLVAVDDVAGEIDEEDLSAADIARLAATILALVDPSGVAGVVAAFSYDKEIILKGAGRYICDYS